MSLPKFALEEFWKKYEFCTPHILCASDAEGWSLQEILSMADQECLALWNSLHLGYTESPGLPLLRKEISSLYESVAPEGILCTAGAEEAIYAAIRSLLEPGDHAIVISPCYQSLKTVAEGCGAHVTTVPLDSTRGWALDTALLAAAFKRRTRMLILNYPHNPTGALLDRETFEEIVRLATLHGCYILSDEVYRYLEIDESARLPSFADAYEKGVAINVMTKSFGLAGLRIGWIASQDAGAVDKIGGYKLYLSICNSATSEILALIALRAREFILQRNRKILLDNIAYVDAFLQRHQGRLSWTPPAGGSMGLIELTQSKSADRLCAAAAAEAGVLIMPGSVIGVEGEFFRIGLGRRNLPEVLGHFETFLVKHSELY